MKKLLFYLPAILFASGSVALNILLRTFSPLWYGWTFLLLICGVLLQNGKRRGALLGLLPSMHLMHMGLQYTGQVINIEFPLGLVTAIYVIACGVFVWRNETS